MLTILFLQQTPLHWYSEMLKYHPLLMGYIAAAVGNCFVTSLPSPKPGGNAFYEWFFNFAHGLLLAIPRIIAQYKNGAAPPPAADRLGK